MPSTYETWADSFRFSEDLKALEHVFQAEQKKILQLQQQLPEASAKTEPPKQPHTEAPVQKAESKDEDSTDLTLDMLSVKIAQRLAQFIGEPEVMAHYLKLHELHADNVTMAQQVNELLEQAQAMESELQDLREELGSYQRWVGPFYLKH